MRMNPGGLSQAALVTVAAGGVFETGVGIRSNCSCIPVATMISATINASAMPASHFLE